MKETIKKGKEKPTEWGKIFANDMSDQGLISKIYFKNSNNLIKKIQWVKVMLKTK